MSETVDLYDQPTYERVELTAVLPTLTLMADLLAGPQQMWDRSAAYIRKWTDEEQAVYDVRRKSEPVFAGLGRTLVAATGMLFAKPPDTEWGPLETTWLPLWDNIDYAGTKGTVFAKRFSDAAIRDGLGIILVDFPPAPQDVVVHGGNEQALGLRPIWSIYERQQAVNWRTETIAGRVVLTQLTLKESHMLPEGAFGCRKATQYRDLRLVGGMAVWQLWTEVESNALGAATYAVTSAGVFRNRVGLPSGVLPVAIGYTGRTTAPMTADVPLQGVAYANLQHWRYATSLTFAREVCGFEQMVVTGQLAANAKTGKPGKLAIGPLTAIQLETGGTATWISPSGTGLAQLEKGVQEKVVQMDQMGLGFLVPNKQVQATATEARIESYAQLATLATAGIAITDALNAAWELTAWYEGAEKVDAPVVHINTEFESAQMDAGTMTAYVELVGAGFPKREVLEALQAGGRVSEDADLDELEMEWESGLAADRASKEAMAMAGAPLPNGAVVVPPNAAVVP